MLQDLVLLNLPPKENYQKSFKIPESERGNIFLLETCQRTLLFSIGQTPLRIIQTNQITPYRTQVYRNKQAYKYLLEVICGLKSKMLAENEVLGQFRTCYKVFTKNTNSNPILLKILEKLLQDSKYIRYHHLLGIGTPSYPSVVRKILIQRIPKGQPIAITGSGHLAEGLIKIMFKQYPLTLFARNKEKAKRLSQKYPIQILLWGNRENLHPFSAIANTIGTNEILFDPNFFNHWQNKLTTKSRLLICMGQPSPIHKAFQNHLNVINLQGIFQQKKNITQIKNKKIQMALDGIQTLTQNRYAQFAPPPSI